jgi:hypothetical protein
MTPAGECIYPLERLLPFYEDIGGINFVDERESSLWLASSIQYKLPITIAEDSVILVCQGDPPALPGRQLQFDESSSRSRGVWKILRKTPHPAAHDRHPLPRRRERVFFRARSRASFPLPRGEAEGRGRERGLLCPFEGLTS